MRNVRHIERDEEFAIAHPALRPKRGAGARREQKAGRARLAALRDAIGIAGKDGSTKRSLASDRGLRIADCGGIRNPAFESLRPP